MSDMGIGSVGSNAAKATSASKDKTLSQADFLSLLTQQMRNQDPTKPMDSSQMLSQLAQISQVSATQSLQASFDSLSQSLQGNQLLQASGMVGRNVTVPSAAGQLQASGLDGAVNVPDGGKAVLVQITDADGNVLRTLSLGTPASGLVAFHWDGKGDDGTALATGLGALPVARLGEHAGTLRPALWGLTVGLMTVASIVGLLIPALEEGSAGAVAAGLAVGIAFLLVSRRVLEHRNVHVGELSAGSARRLTDSRKTFCALTTLPFMIAMTAATETSSWDSCQQS